LTDVVPEPDDLLELHGYWRSTASWRVRIALAWKGVAYRPVSHDLRTGAQRDPAYLALNPQGYVPALVLGDGRVLTQSPAILEYLEEAYPAPPLLPADAVARARVRAVAAIVACDIHPIQNLAILKRITALGSDADAWARTVIGDGLAACEALVGEGPFAFGTTPTLADVLIVPQLANARRFACAMPWPRLLALDAACMALPAFADTAPDRQPDAPTAKS
jgi:maleylpyruvate isomerase